MCIRDRSWLSQNDGVPPGGKLLTPLSLSAMLAGSVMTIVSALDGFNWLLFGETPAPNEHVISGIDGVKMCIRDRDEDARIAGEPVPARSYRVLPG